MALQIRRGSETDLSTFTPAIGELVFDTTNKKLYIGDGVTVGGIDVSIAGGIGGPLSSTINLNTFNIVGVGDINLDGSITATGSVLGSFEGTLQGDVVGTLIGDAYGNLVGGSVFGSDSSVIIDGITNTVVGDLTGKVLSSITGNIVLDNSLWTPMYYGSVSGNVAGDVIGDVYGNVVGVDSLLMVDATNTVLRVRDIEISENNIDAGSQSLNIKSNNIRALEVFGSTTGAPGNIPYIHLNTSRGTTEEPSNMQPGDIIGGFGFRAFNGNDYKLTAANLFAVIDPTANIADLAPKTAFIIQTGRGNTDVNYFTYSSQFTASGYGFHFASFNTSTGNFDNFADATARDSIITNPSPGMITYVENNGSGSPKFQGYVSDTGGGSPGWVDLH